MKGIDMEDLQPLFRPKSIAVIGASRNREKVGNVILRNLIATFRGKIYAVNNKAESVEGIKAFKDIKEIQDDIDLAIIAVPRDYVIQVFEDMIDKGVRYAIIITAGFKEIGKEGEKLEQELVSKAKKGGIRFLGPNTMGIISPDYNGTFAFGDVKRGNIALVVQSGGIGAYMLDWARKTRTGISYLVSLGNQADIKEYEVIDYLSRDPETKAIFVYIEGISDGSKFLEFLPEAAERKTIVFIKGGITLKGSEAVMTHTGSLAGSYEVFKAAIKTVGGILVENLRDFLNLSKIIATSEPIRPEILIITNSGGHGVLASDSVETNGLTLIEIPERIKNELRKVLPITSTPRNPIDVTGDAGRDRYINVLKIVSDLDCTKIVIVEALPFISTTEVAKALLQFKGKGIVAVLMGEDEDFSSKLIESANMPAFNFPEDAIKAIRYITSKPIPRKKIRIAQPITESYELIKGKQYLKDYEALKLMEIYGIRTPKWGIAEDENEAQHIADSIGYPVVMKISPDKPIHKTELKGVVMNVESDQVKDVYRKLSPITKRVLIQQQLNGLEVFVGGIKDQVFGHTVIVGSGGIYVEILKNVSYALAPVYEEEALEMLKESKVYDMLTVRKRGYDIGSLLRTIVTVSRLIVDLNVKEMDINPLIVNENGAFAVDTRIVFS
ncbi:acetyl-CoA synthetase [Saccharolobus caldissimus]|uniref:Acetyl-CoA synthetase n=2 Tax=Saccharolobus caldissimus TaxID=1702097 RepID=A0AAQ4CNX9_9CREN|nr:acetyl-CoA synthetase [Saccharolobus caldissimus]